MECLSVEERYVCGGSGGGGGNESEFNRMDPGMSRQSSHMVFLCVFLLNAWLLIGEPERERER